MNDMADTDIVQQWTNFMDPDRLKPNLELTFNRDYTKSPLLGALFL